ncbi:MAG: hypothetical protein EKK48_12160 [Candidatus Melainabacteria bacterium]|nr:MAG: hypothetical protein EKK48_12160 [Candidatus Melainabacteria bacterium]
MHQQFLLARTGLTNKTTERKRVLVDISNINYYRELTDDEFMIAKVNEAHTEAVTAVWLKTGECLYVLATFDAIRNMINPPVSVRPRRQIEKRGA